MNAGRARCMSIRRAWSSYNQNSVHVGRHSFISVLVNPQLNRGSNENLVQGATQPSVIIHRVHTPEHISILCHRCMTSASKGEPDSDIVYTEFRPRIRGNTTCSMGNFKLERALRVGGKRRCDKLEPTGWSDLTEKTGNHGP